jgi:hypothetical protein
LRRWPCWPGPYSRLLTGSSGGPRHSGPCGGRSCTSPRGAWSSRPHIGSGLRIAPSFVPVLDRNRQVLQPKRKSLCENLQNRGSRNTARAKMAREMGRFLGVFAGGCQTPVEAASASPKRASACGQRGRRRPAGGENGRGLAAKRRPGPADPADPPPGGRWPGPDRSISPARPRAFRSRAAAADSACRPARRCRCACRPSRRSRARSRRRIVIG